MNNTLSINGLTIEYVGNANGFAVLNTSDLIAQIEEMVAQALDAELLIANKEKN